MAYLLHYVDAARDLKVLKFAEPKLADVYSYDVLPNSRTAKIVSGEDSLRDRTNFSTGLLAAIYNALGPDKVVTKFETHDVAARRTFSLLDEKFKHLEVTSVTLAAEPQMNLPTTQETTNMGKPKRANAAGVAVKKIAVKSAGNLSEFRPIRDESDRAKILKLMDGTRTPDEIAAQMGGEKFDSKYVMAHAYCIRRDCGIGYELTKDGHLNALYPRGKTYEDAIKRVERREPAAARTRAARTEEEAAA